MAASTVVLRLMLLNSVCAQVLQAAFGGSPASLYGNALKLLAASPLDACSQLANADQVAGTVLLMQRGNCTFASKVSCMACPSFGGGNYLMPDLSSLNEAS